MIAAFPALLALLSTPALAEPSDCASDDFVEVREELHQLRAEIAEMREVIEREQAPTVSEASTPSDRVGFGNATRVEAGEQVDEVVAFGHDVLVAGHVLGDATSFGGDVRVERTGVVDGNAIAFGGSVEVEEGGKVRGGSIDMEMPVGQQDAEVSALGAIGSLASPSEMLSRLYHRLVVMLSFAGAGVLIVGLFPRRVGRIARAVELHPIRAGFVGLFGSGFLFLFSLLFAAITFGLGLPVSMMVWAMLGLAWLLGFVGVCQAVGDRLPFEQKPHGRWLAFLVGTVLLSFAGSLPLVGLVIVGLGSLVGMGAAISTRFGGR